MASFSRECRLTSVRMARVSLLWALPTNVCTRGTRAHLMTAIMLGCFRIDLHRGEWLWLWMINAPPPRLVTRPVRFKTTGIRKTTKQHLCMWISLFLRIFLRAFFPVFSWEFQIYAFSDSENSSHKHKHTQKHPLQDGITLSRLSGPSVFPLQWFTCVSLFPVL